MPEPSDEIQEILNFLLPFAEQRLNEHGEFYPYAAAVDSEGELSAVGAQVDESESPDVGEVLLALHEGLRAQPADVFVPYETESGGIKFGELVAAEGREPVFAHAAS